MRATTTTTTARMLSRPRCRRESPAALPVPRRLCTLRLVARESPAALPVLRRLAPSIPVLACLLVRRRTAMSGQQMTA